MKTYLVGGAVRDMLIGIHYQSDAATQDYDYVVVGATPHQMFEAGFTRVGADFPVFLSSSGDEYALARRERKTGKGYLGFESEYGSDVTLEEDLLRRDLTINSIAYDIDGYSGFIDPHNGEQDILDKILRHTSEAFSEDPVRVLRIARFRARFGTEWEVAPETQALIHSMAKSGTLSELTPERVWKELSRALMEPYPRVFFDTLLQCDALQAVFPEIYRLKTALESRRWHPEGDAYEHTMLVLQQAQQQGYNLCTRYAALVHDLGKGLTPRDKLPKHYGHDIAGVAVVEALGQRLRVPTSITKHAKVSTRYHMYMHKLDTLNAKTLVKAFDSIKQAEYIQTLLEVGRCDARGRLGFEDVDIEPLDLLLKLHRAYESVKFSNIFPEGETRVERIKQELYRARIAALNKVKR